MVDNPRGVNASRRALDLLLAVPALVIAAPVIAVAALLIRVQMGAPVLFRQERAGRKGSPFTLLKLRTMSEPVEDGRADDSDAGRLTPLGCRLRAWSVDELPQLWNVIRGEMALVGPRPLPTRYVPRYSSEQSHRLDVRPGITGLAQVSGRNRLSWADRLALDVDYVQRRGVRLDLVILMRTALAVFAHDGITSEGHATMPEFEGVEPA